MARIESNQEKKSVYDLCSDWVVLCNNDTGNHTCYMGDQYIHILVDNDLSSDIITDEETNIGPYLDVMVSVKY